MAEWQLLPLGETELWLISPQHSRARAVSFAQLKVKDLVVAGIQLELNLNTSSDLQFWRNVVEAHGGKEPWVS